MVYRDIEKNIKSDRQNCFSRNSYLCEGSFRNCVTQKFGALTYARVRELQYVNIQNTGLRKTIVSLLHLEGGVSKVFIIYVCVNGGIGKDKGKKLNTKKSE